MNKQQRTRRSILALAAVVSVMALGLAGPAFAQHPDNGGGGGGGTPPSPTPAPNIPTIVISTPGATITISGTNFCPPGQANQGNCTSTGNPPPVRITHTNNSGGGTTQLEVAAAPVDARGRFEVSIPRSSLVGAGGVAAAALQVVGVGVDGDTYGAAVRVPEPDADAVVARLYRAMEGIASNAAPLTAEDPAPAMDMDAVPAVVTRIGSGLTVGTALLVLMLGVAGFAVWASRRRLLTH